MTSHHCPTCFGITRLDSENVRWCQCPTTRDRDAEIARLRELARKAYDEGRLHADVRPEELTLWGLATWEHSNAKKELERQ